MNRKNTDVRLKDFSSNKKVDEEQKLLIKSYEKDGNSAETTLPNDETRISEQQDVQKIQDDKLPTNYTTDARKPSEEVTTHRPKSV